MNNQVKQLTTENFDKEVLQNPGTVLVDFWAAWCGPCRALGPVIDELANELGDRVTVAKLNVDEHSEIAQHFGIRSIPNVLIFHDGQIVETISGVQSKQAYLAAIERIHQTTV